uniref:Cytochrome c oxidase subunit NDUFA4 n=1 Tax=Oncorhynchus tshawytscha TaxID=74940 RepID=A0AAZ3PWK7_ONCTS
MLSTVSRQLKSHPALVPLFIFIGGGTVMSGAYLLRLAMGPHVSWNRNGNPEPWNKTEPTQQHKVVLLSEHGLQQAEERGS